MSKNHVQVYRELMKEIDPELPDGDSIDFIHPRHELNEPRVWKAAIAQLIISLFPHEFLPEILGFNMHYELLTLETLKAAHELAELKLDAYYFALHVSIDNADSGHTAIAKEAVVKYLSHVETTLGQSAVQRIWKRVQAGYVLSDYLSASPERPSRRKIAVDSFPKNELEAKVISIFKAKAPVAHRIHCSSQLKVGRRTLVNWLAPEAFESTQWQMDFLEDLGNKRPWVRKGEGSKSRLIKELSWAGKMFGSFTQKEVDTVKRWIDSLGDANPRFYWSFVSRAEIPSDQALRNRDICVDYPVLSPITTDTFYFPCSISSSMEFTVSDRADRILAVSDMAKFFAMWFAHPCLLESFVCTPYKTTTRTACATVRLLRAQYGFDVEGSGVAGMDEVHRAESVGLVELGLEMTKRARLPEPDCLADVLNCGQSEFVVLMLHWSMRPMSNAPFLLGLALAFVGLHRAVAESTNELLSAASREVLAHIACREQASLEICMEELRDDAGKHTDFRRGYHRGMIEMGSFLGKDDSRCECTNSRNGLP